jgi:hypothetical protein
MRSARSRLVLALTAVLATGCSDDGGTDVDTITIDDFVGSWSASSQVFPSHGDPNETFDLIANGGETRMTVLSHGGARTWVEFGTFADEWDAQLMVDGNMLTSTPVEASRPVRHFSFVHDGDTVTLTNTDDAFDFTLSGADPVPATMVIVLERQ